MRSRHGVNRERKRGTIIEVISLRTSHFAPRTLLLFGRCGPCDHPAALCLALAVASNRDHRLRRLLRELRLDRYFRTIVISSEAGFAKPFPVIFEAVLRQLGRPAGGVLHIGNSLREDFAGATAAGFSALHLDRGSPSRDLQIGSLADVGRWLAGA